MAQARQHPALISSTGSTGSIAVIIALAVLVLIAVLVPASWAVADEAPAAPDASTCVAEHARVAQAEGTDAARAAFASCARKTYGDGVQAQLESCTSDLYTLPVILLYRGEGLSKAVALADMRRDDQTDPDTTEGRRALLMLDFAYQGGGPAPGQTQAWLDLRTVHWTDRCLRGAIAN